MTNAVDLHTGIKVGDRVALDSAGYPEYVVTEIDEDGLFTVENEIVKFVTADEIVALVINPVCFILADGTTVREL